MLTTKQSRESLKKFTDRMMTTLQGAYSNFRPHENPDQLRVYVDAIGRMVSEFGQGRTAVAIGKAVDYIPDFVPTVAKIREFIPAAEGTRKTCTLCHPSGYVYVFEGRTASGLKIDPRFGAAKLCSHKDGLSPVINVNEEHGKTYGENDCLILWKLVRERMAENPYPLTEREQAMLLDKLDEITGRTK